MTAAIKPLTGKLLLRGFIVFRYKYLLSNVPRQSIIDIQTYKQEFNYDAR